MSRVIVNGATSEAVRPLLLHIATRGCSFALIGRNPIALAATATALHAAGAPGVSLQVIGADPSVRDLRAAVADAGTAGPFDIALDFTGSIAPEASLDAEGRARLLRANCELPIAFVDAVLPLMRPRGVVAVAGSVAAIRPRASIRTYAMAKACIAEELAARAATSPVRLLELRFGPMATRMHPRRAGRAPVDPARLVPAIDAALGSAQGVVYLPPIWRLLGAILARLPQALIDRIA